MDPEDFGNLTDNASDVRDVHHDLPSDLVLIPTVAVTLTSILADVFIVYVVAKFRDLHTVRNWYLLHWRIASVLFLALSPINFMALALVVYVEASVACIWFVEILVTFTGNLFFIVAMTVDWYMLYFAPHAIYVKIRSYYRSEIGLIWLVVIALSVSICFECMLSHFHIWVFLIEFIYTIFIAVMHVLRFVKSRSLSDSDERPNLVLVLATSHFLCWFPLSLLHFVRMFYSELAIYPEVTVLITMIGYSNSIFVIVILYYYDKDFYTGFKSMCNYGMESNNSESSYESIDLKSGEVPLLPPT